MALQLVVRKALRIPAVKPVLASTRRPSRDVRKIAYSVPLSLCSARNLSVRWYAKKSSSGGKGSPAPSASGSKLPEEAQEETETTEQAAATETVENNESKTNEAAATKPKQRLRVNMRPVTPPKDAPAYDKVESDSALKTSAILSLFKPGSPIPPTAFVLASNNLHAVMAMPSMLSVDVESQDHTNYLRQLAKSSTPIALIYAMPIETVVNDKGEKAPGYYGMLCGIHGVVKHKIHNRCEVTLIPLRRIRLSKDRPATRSFTTADIEDWPYLPLDQPDIEDIIASALPLQASTGVQDMKIRGATISLAELLLHNTAANILHSLGRYDASGVRQVLEQAFPERDMHVKLQLLQRAVGMVTISHELTHNIEDMTERRKWQGIDQQMEKMLRQQLADPSIDPDAKLAAQIAELPEHVRPVAEKEFEYMKSLDANGSEHGVSSTYLDWLVHIPWTKTSVDRFNMAEAKAILDKTHHGLDDVKVKILQLMANASRTGKISAKPILLVGPPGTGKTSFAKAIAESLGRKFISLAGLTETNDLRGHRRTYVGSVPGKIASEMRRAGVKNPVIVLDEVDKIEDSQRHRPLTPALLELLSPDQNKTFYDQYLDVPLDCSEVLFICTANSLETISAPLLNRLQVVELRAYSSSEKFDIAKEYVLPSTIEESGLANITMTDEALRTLVQVYSKYEAGVRQIRRHLQRIMRQLAVKAVTSGITDPKNFSCEITKDKMLDLLEAPEESHGDRIYDEPPIGVVNGLAKNMYGGSTLTIEAIADTHRGKQGKTGGVEFTGNIMETMKESSDIAYTYAKSFLAKHFPENTFLATSHLHVHVPFGKVKKDGPSAGCALVCTYVSLALKHALPRTLCMTGEITLTGRVTAVGGIREKVTAAAQNGMTDVLIPLQNKADFEAIPKDLVETIKPHYVSTFEEAFKAAFGLPLPLTDQAANVAKSPSKSGRLPRSQVVVAKVPPSSKHPKPTKIAPPPLVDPTIPSGIVDEKHHPKMPLSAYGSTPAL